MASVDSGVETGNDSNDSSVNQHENNIQGSMQVLIPAGQQVSLRLPVGSTAPSLEVATNRPLTINNQVAAVDRPGSQPHSRALRVRNLLFPNLDMNLIKSISVPTNYVESPHIMRKKIRACESHPSYYRLINMNPYRDLSTKRRMRLAAATNNIEMMKNYLSLGISPNNSDEQGRSPLHLASCRGFTEMVELLLRHGANPNMRDCVGNTPLHLAAISSKISVVTLLLKAGTDVLSTDQLGYNPLQLAQTKLRLLQNCNGADMNAYMEEFRNVVDMLLAYLQKQKNAREDVEALTMVCSRLSLSNTSEQIQDDVRDLLANLGSLNIANSASTSS